MTLPVAQKTRSVAGRGVDVKDGEILRVFLEHAEPVLTTSEVADGVSIGRQAVHSRLQQFEENGLVISKRAGSARIWWLTPEGRQRAADY
jgi:DNA-binding MarR family transcriptional regulator